MSNYREDNSINYGKSCHTEVFKNVTHLVFSDMRENTQYDIK